MSTQQDASVSPSALEAYFESRQPDRSPHEVINLSPAGTAIGRSDRTYTFDLRTNAGSGSRTARSLAVRVKDIGIEPGEQSHRTYFEALDFLNDYDRIPTPEVFFYEDDPRHLGAPFFVMERVDGETYLSWSKEGREFLREAGQGAIGEQFVRILADLHSIPRREWDKSHFTAPSPPSRFPWQLIEFVEEMLADVRMDVPPLFVDALHWLKSNVPPVDELSLVHGDYRSGNIIFGPDEIRAILDWELSRIGDPHWDVAWVCAPSNQIKSDLVVYMLEEEKFLAMYEEFSGRSLDADKLHFYQVYYQVWHAALWLSAYDSYQRGRTDALKHARVQFSMPRMKMLVADLLDYPTDDDS